MFNTLSARTSTNSKMHSLRKLIGNKKHSLKIFYNHCILNVNRLRCLSTNDKPAIILGIETSCDDTGFAVVDSTGKILGEALNSQLLHHLPEGGIEPPVARDLHVQNIESVYEECMKSSNIKLEDVDAIAVTLEPGLPLSLIVGRDFCLKLSRLANKPVIPIHHMQAHALTVRMVEKVDYPFLVLLISGGHCILALAEAVDKFKILGESIDGGPGEAFDKVARRLKLMNIFEYNQICGGQAIELAAQKADNPDQFEFEVPLARYRDCNFSFSGLKTKTRLHTMKQEEKYNVRGTDIIPDVNNLCAGILMAITKHLCLRTQRAMEFIEKKELIPEDKKTLVVSGGVASNNFIFNALRKVCEETGYKLVRPPPKLCTDNGIMIAWNGVEKYLANVGILRDRNEIDKIDILHRKPIGEDWSRMVANDGIKRKWVKLKFHELVDR